VELVTHRELHFAHSRAEVWAAMGDVDSYQRWWPWLRTFEAQGLISGGEWRCTVRPPLPYTVSFVITFSDVVAEEHAVARVTGDIAGVAELTLRDRDGGCEVVVRSDLAAQSGFLRVLAATLPPVARYGHDWILSTGAAQFEARAFSPTSGVQDTTT
jgi:uncharacterized protein YndB with AHSA1/START domain